MTYRIVFRPVARDDLFGLYDYIAEQSGRERALDYIDRIEMACVRLGEFPEQGRHRDDIKPGIRTFGFERRVLIVYRIADATVEILRILYAGWELPKNSDDW